MAYWTGEIVFKSDWTAHSEKQMPLIIYDWEAHETQTWKLNGPPTADIYSVTWTITGWGKDSDDHPVSQQKWTSNWTINGSNNSPPAWPIDIRIRELSNYIWRVEPTANGKNALNVIDMNQKRIESGKIADDDNSKLNWHELNIPPIEVEKSASISARLTGGSTSLVTGPSGFRLWSLLPESLRNSLTGWIIHDEHVPDTDPAFPLSVWDPRNGSKLDPPGSLITGACTWSWRLEETT